MGTSTTQHEANSAIEKAIRSFVGVLTNAQSKVRTASVPQTTDEPPALHQTVTSSIQREMQRLGGCFAEDLRKSSAECKVISREITRKLQAAVPRKRHYRQPSSSRPVPNRSFLEMFQGRKNRGKPTIPHSRLIIPAAQHQELNFCLLPDCTTKSPKNEMELFQAGLGRRTLSIAISADDEQEFNCEQVHEDDQVLQNKPDVICTEVQVQENIKLAAPCAVPSSMGDSGPSSECQVALGRQVLHQLQTRLEQVCQERPLDYDSVEFICTSVMTLICSLSAHIHFPQEVLDGLMQLSTLLNAEMERGRMAIMVESTVGECGGRPKLVVSEHHLVGLIEMDLSVLCISKLLGVSVRTVRRRMQELGLSKRNRHSSLTDEELDRLVLEIKQDSRDFGYRRVKGRLKDLGHRVQWARVMEAMHRVDSCGVLERMAGLGFVARKTYSVPAPLSLLHVNTNRKLVRYGMVMFGGIDRFSRKILYVKAANNNKASTALGFFLEAAEKHGFPSRVCGDLEVENVDIARRMFEVRGYGRGSFTSGKDVMDQWSERLWRDVWNAVSSVYYDVLSSLEEDRLLDPANSTSLYCAQYVFLPRIQTDLDTFAEGWNNRSLRRSRESTPNKLCKTGTTPCSVDATENSEGHQLADVNVSDMECSGKQVPELVCPLDNEEVEKMTQVFNPNAPSSCFGADIYCAVVQYVRKVVESRSCTSELISRRMMPAGVRLRQDTGASQPELPERHRIREKEEELHSLESVHMAEPEIKSSTQGLKSPELESVTEIGGDSDLYSLDTSLIKAETDLGDSTCGSLKTDSLDFPDLTHVTCLHSDQIKTETEDGDCSKDEHISVMIKCIDGESDEVKLESNEGLVNDLMNTVLNGASVDEKDQAESRQCVAEPHPNYMGVKVYKCNQCERDFSKKSNLNSHQRTHTGEKPFKCDQCEKSFLRKFSLISHQRVHSGEKPYHCDQCGKWFRSKSNLSSHRSVHTSKKSHKCNQCDKMFSRKTSLEYHWRIHTGEKPHKCDRCGKRFRTKSNLYSHEQIHIVEMPYKCNQCEKSFLWKSYLKFHMRVHTDEKPFKCNQCEKSFLWKSNLNSHTRVHSGEKPFKCDQCGRSFVLRSYLKSHQGVHVGEKPFKCDQCGRSYLLKASLTRHAQTHTDVKHKKCDL